MIAEREEQYNRTQRISQRQQPLLEFVHIPKTGGSTIENLSVRHGISWGWCHYALRVGGSPLFPPSQHYRAYLDDYVRNTPKEDQWPPFWHIPPRYFQSKNATELPTHVNPFPPTKPLFAVVRNPYTRLISEWYFIAQRQWKAGPEKYNNATEFNTFLKKTLTILSQVETSAAQNTDMTRNNLYWIHSAHFVPQYDFIYDDNDTQVVQHVLKFETLAQDFSALMIQYGLHDMVMNDERRINHSQDKQLSMLNITEENMALIHLFYRRDFERFGYAMVQP